MLAGFIFVGSRTAPVEDVIRHGENGWLVDSFDLQSRYLPRQLALLQALVG
jgi:hypothetical protein